MLNNDIRSLSHETLVQLLVVVMLYSKVDTLVFDDNHVDDTNDKKTMTVEQKENAIILYLIDDDSNDKENKFIEEYVLDEDEGLSNEDIDKILTDKDSEF